MCRTHAGGLYQVTRVRAQLCGAMEETQGGWRWEPETACAPGHFACFWSSGSSCSLLCDGVQLQDLSEAISFNIASTLLRIRVSGTHACQHTLAHARVHACIRVHPCARAFCHLPRCSGNKPPSKRTRVQLCLKGKEKVQKLVPLCSSSFVPCNHG